MKPVSLSSVAARKPSIRVHAVGTTGAKTVVRRVPYEVNEWQLPFLIDDETHTLGAIGGIGSGKTWALMHWLFEERMRQPTDIPGLLFGNTYGQLEQSVLPHLWRTVEDDFGMEYGRDYVYNERPPRGWLTFRSAFRKHNGVISFRRYGQLVVRSLDDFDNVRGIEGGFAAFDELRDTKREAWQVAIARVRIGKKRRIRFSTSPRMGWLYMEFIEKAGKFPPPERRIIRMRSADNKFIDAEVFEQTRRAYDPKFAQQELEGEFVALTEGLVYHQFDARLHVVEVPPPNPNIDWQVCYDFNRNPFSVVLCQTPGFNRDNDDSAYSSETKIIVYHCIALRDADTVAASREVFRIISEFGGAGKHVEVYGDASGRTKNTKNNLSDYDIIRTMFQERYGDRFIPQWRSSNPSVQGRINAVNARLRNVNGEIGLYVSNQVNPDTGEQVCAPLRRDFEQVCYKPGTGEISKTKEESDLTHASDGLGYYVVDRFPVRRADGARMSIDF